MIQEYYKVLDLIAKERHPVAKVFQLDGLVRASLQAAAFGVL